MPDFDPLNPLMSFLLGYDSDVVRDVLYRTGVPANFELNERERFSHRTRSSAYDQRFRRAYNELDDNQKYRASYIIAERLVAIDVGNQDRLNGSLNNIGWRIDYILAAPAIATRVESCTVLSDIGTSDHAPVMATIA